MHLSLPSVRGWSGVSWRRDNWDCGICTANEIIKGTTGPRIWLLSPEPQQTCGFLKAPQKYWGIFPDSEWWKTPKQNKIISVNATNPLSQRIAKFHTRPQTPQKRIHPKHLKTKINIPSIFSLCMALDTIWTHARSGLCRPLMEADHDKYNFQALRSARPKVKSWMLAYPTRSHRY